MLSPTQKEKIREILINVTKQRSVIFYSVLNKMLSDNSIIELDLEYIDDRNTISDILDEINCDESSEGRPMLSVVVVKIGDYIPGDGFFKLARELGKQQKGERDNDYQ